VLPFDSDPVEGIGAIDEVVGSTVAAVEVVIPTVAEVISVLEVMIEVGLGAGGLGAGGGFVAGGFGAGGFGAGGFAVGSGAAGAAAICACGAEGGAGMGARFCSPKTGEPGRAIETKAPGGEDDGRQVNRAVDRKEEEDAISSCGEVRDSRRWHRGKGE